MREVAGINTAERGEIRNDAIPSGDIEDELILNDERREKDVLYEMETHLKQMEQELSIVGEESKELQQRLISRDEELKKKV